MTGVPQIVSAQTTAGQDDCLAVLLSRAGKCNSGEIAERMLKQFVDPAIIIICPEVRLVVGTTHADTRDMMRDAWAADEGDTFTVQQRSGGGLVSKWETVSNTLPAELADQFANAYNKRSLAGLLQAVAAWCESNQVPELAVCIDQATGQVTFKESGGFLADVLPTLATAGQTVAIKYEAPKPKRVFI